jgi:EmrB/QacA subfamily drug resistance transporter
VSRGWKVLLLTSVGVYLVSLDVSILNVAFGTLLEHFGPERRTVLTWVFSGYNIAFAAALLSAGRAADRYGRKRVFLLGIVVFAIGSALCAAAPSAWALVAARVVQAMGAALVMPASLALVLPEFPLERRSMAIGVWGAVGGIAAATGPTIGGLLVEHFGWRSVFVINLPVCAAALVVGSRLLRESKEARAVGLPDVIGAVLAMTGVGLLTLAVVQGEGWGWGSPRILATVLASAALLAWFVARSRRHPAPVLDLALLRLRFFTASNTAALVFSMGFFGMFFTNIQFLQSEWGYSIVGSGLAMTPGPLLAAAWAAPAGRMAQRYGHQQVIVPGLALFALGILLMIAFAGPEPDYWREWFPALVLTGSGLGLAFPTIGSAANAYLPPDRFAMGSAFNATCRQVGAALGIAVVTALRATSGEDGLAGFDRSWWFIVATALVAGVVMVTRYRRPTPAEVQAADIPVPTGFPLPTGR